MHLQLPINTPIIPCEVNFNPPLLCASSPSIKLKRIPFIPINSIRGILRSSGIDGYISVRFGNAAEVGGAKTFRDWPGLASLEDLNLVIPWGHVKAGVVAVDIEELADEGYACGGERGGRCEGEEGRSEERRVGKECPV